MSVRIKLCGLKEIAHIKKANELKPEYIGYIFAPNRKRTISLDRAKELTGELDKNIIPVGVFKNNPYEDIVAAVESGTIQMIQLHGKEDKNFIDKLKQDLKIPIIKAYGIASSDDIDDANSSNADYVLLDTPGGGTGFLFDHELLDGMKREYFLAGGLDPDNVAECIGELSPFAVDVSSGIETEGAKDIKKMEAFVYNVRNGKRN